MNGQEEFSAATQTKAAAERKKYLESRFYVVRGLLMLLAGSIPLLCCKLAPPGLITQLLALAGCAVILLANGYILFGLLIYADSRPD